jgi:hypothetical protein
LSIFFIFIHFFKCQCVSQNIQWIDHNETIQKISIYNNIFNFVKENKLYNYADDNTLSHSGPDLNWLVNSLEKESAILKRH